MSSRTIVVTGAYGALGSVVAAAFAAAGDKVARVDFAAAPSEAMLNGIDIGRVDLTDFVEARRAVSEIFSALGSIDVLVNIAGGFIWQTLADGDSATWQRMFEMNAVTCINMTKAALPKLGRAKDARIINIGAGSAIVAAAGMGAYAASKMAVHKLTESLSDELEGQDITVNAILPGIIDTPANRASMPDVDFATWVTPEAIAAVILFLSSTSARAINGALIPLTKGFHA